MGGRLLYARARLERGAALEGGPRARLEQLDKVDTGEAVDSEHLLEERRLLWGTQGEARVIRLSCDADRAR